MTIPDVTHHLPNAMEAIWELRELSSLLNKLETSGGLETTHLTRMRLLPDLALAMEKALFRMRAIPGVKEAIAGFPPSEVGFVYKGREEKVIPRWREALRLALLRLEPDSREVIVGLDPTFLLGILRVESLTREETKLVYSWMREWGWEDIRQRSHSGLVVTRWVRAGQRHPNLIWVSPTSRLPISPTPR